MTWDIIIVSNAVSEGLYALTQNTIRNLRAIEGKIKYNIVFIEQTKKDFSAKTIHYDFPFNYNKCLNLGISRTENDVLVLCNNDLHFEKGWAERLNMGFMMGYRSLSPYCKTASRRWLPMGNHLIEGFNIGIHITGWCIALKRDVLKEIGGLCEEVDFWYSDNIYGKQIEKAKIKHAIVCNAFVNHMTSLTLNSSTAESKSKFTVGNKKKYDQALIKLYAKD
jgi:hypothetical protein